MPKRPAEDATKLKRIRVWDRIDEYGIDGELQGLVKDVLENITKLHMDAATKGWKEIRLVHEGDYDSCWYELHGTRLETDVEMRRRFAKIRKKRAKAPKKKK